MPQALPSGPLSQLGFQRCTEELGSRFPSPAGVGRFNPWVDAVEVLIFRYFYPFLFLPGTTFLIHPLPEILSHPGTKRVLCL